MTNQKIINVSKENIENKVYEMHIKFIRKICGHL